VLRTFYRDGFLDRYSGVKPVHLGALRALSVIVPEGSLRMSQSHFASWELFPTIDHLLPVGRGGADDESNWMSWSLLRNSAKAHWALGELGWELSHPATTGSGTGWPDGSSNIYTHVRN
jgi:hypothetical protein